MKDRVGEGFISIFKLSLIFLGFNSFVFGSEIYEKVRFEEERSFSHKEHFLGLTTGISLPSVTVGKDNYYHYQQNLQLELRGNLFKRIDYSLNANYGKALSKNWSEKVLKEESLKGDFLLGYAFPEIKPGWRLVLRGGVYVNDLNLVQLSHGRKNIIAPQVSPLWLYEQKDGSLFHMSLSYIHLDRGQFFSKSGDDREFGLGFQVGEVIPISKKFGFLYNFNFERLRVGDKNLNSNTLQNFSLNVGFGI